MPKTKKKEAKKSKGSASLVLDGQIYLLEKRPGLPDEKSPIDGKLVLNLLLVVIREALERRLAELETKRRG